MDEFLFERLTPPLSLSFWEGEGTARNADVRLDNLVAAAPLDPISISQRSDAPKKRRRAVTVTERIAIRKYKSNPDNANPSHKQIIAWFKDEHGRTLGGASISETLSDNFAHLDNTKISKPYQKKERPSQYPDLENALNDWQIVAVRRGQVVTGDLLKEMALRLFKRLPQYANRPNPGFSNGWLQGFKRRYNIKQRVRHGEAAQVDLVAVEGSLVELRATCQIYPACNTYNMDESAYYWKATPDKTLASESLPGGKLAKARITANFCCNADGTDKVPILFIGTAAKPRCFKNVNINNLGIRWTNNTKGWMTGIVFKEYIMWLNHYLAGDHVERQCLLLLDSFSAHIAGIEMLKADEHDLRNLRIEFLPTNATSVCQPLDQGIIRTWKAYVRRQWIQYSADCYDANKLPEQEMVVLNALRWGVYAWHNDIKPSTIENCWLKARVLAPKYGPMTEQESQRSGLYFGHERDEAQRMAAIAHDSQCVREVEEDIESTMQRLQSAGHIREAMALENFLNPTSEVVDDEPEEMFERVIDIYGYRQGEEEVDEDCNEPVPKVRHEEALAALSILRLYEEQRQDDEGAIIRRLNDLELDIKRLKMNTARQRQLPELWRAQMATQHNT
jgi:hypothetical protein